MAESQIQPTQSTTRVTAAALTPPNPVARALEFVRGTTGWVWKFARMKPLGAFGGLLILIIGVLAAFPGLFTNFDPLRVAGEPYQAVNGTHWLGTDSIGRDIWTRTIYGARITMQISVISVVISVTAATIIAMVSAYYGGVLDMLVQRAVDTILAVPGLILALFILTVMGSSMRTIIFTIVIVFLPRSIRTIRSSVLSVKEMPYVESARAIGASTPRILLKYIFPQITALYLILLSLIIGNAIIIESSLAFLGLGLAVETPSWGALVDRGIEDIFFAPWTQPVAPGVAIAMAVFGFNLFGDALRDIMDPRLRGSGVGLKRGGGGATSSG